MIEAVQTLEQTARLQGNAEKFDAMVRMLRRLCDRQQHRSAAVLGEICALFGVYNHTGTFFSQDLEQVLTLIGARTIKMGRARPDRHAADPIKRILHVLTIAKPVGGDSRYVWRWINQDIDRHHSVALTRQSSFEIPAILRDAVTNRGGEIHVLDANDEDVIERARALRTLVSDYDAVFLHVHVEDIVPAIALFEGVDLPPIVLVMQADYQLVVGLTVSDAVVHVRQSGRRLSQYRRGVNEERLGFLPIPLEPVVRKLSQSQARRQLDLPEEAVVLLSIARSVKYTRVVDPSFIDLAVMILSRHPNAIMIVVGATETAEWQKGSRSTQGRLKAVGPRIDTAAFYEAADIYLDSYPFASNTSLLEAGSLGLPLVAYFPFSEGVEVLGADAPGIDGVLMKTRTIPHYMETISSLIEDPARRKHVGEKTRNQILEHHVGKYWHDSLKETMALVASTSPRSRANIVEPASQREDLDHVLASLFRHEAPLGNLISRFAARLDYTARVRLLLSLSRIDRSFSFQLLLPRTLARVVGRHFHGWRRLPGLRHIVRSSASHET